MGNSPGDENRSSVTEPYAAVVRLKRALPFRRVPAGIASVGAGLTACTFGESVKQKRNTETTKGGIVVLN